MNVDRMVLFIYEIGLLRDIEFITNDDRDYLLEYPIGPQMIDKAFISQLNNFFEIIYREDKESLEVLFDNFGILDEFVKERYNILEYDIVSKILENYMGIDGYLYLLELVDEDTNMKIIELVNRFVEYYNSILELYNCKYTGYKKILQ